ncbi:MAG: zinc-dependent alcohol dehydrogenase [Phycisphaerae bacterium]
MKALLLTDRKKLELADMPIPEFGPDDLLVRIKTCGICGSDVHGYDGSTGRRIPPIVMGHEAAGIVEKCGSNVRDFKPGDRITFDSTISCGHCAYCRAGRINLCDNRRVLGVSCNEYRQHGCFAEFATIPVRIAYHLPDSLSFEHAAMIEPVSIAVHALSRAASATPTGLLGKSALVVGAGMIGQLLLQTLRVAGVSTLLATDIDPARLQTAKTAGATHTLPANAPDLVQQIHGLTHGGLDLVFEAVGAGPSIHTAITAARKGATIVLVGNVSPTVPLPLQSVVTRELTLLGTAASNGEYPTCIDLLATKKVNVASLISATAPLDQGPTYFDRLYNKDPALLKVLLTP